MTRGALLATAGATLGTLSVRAATAVRLGGPIFLKSDDPAALAREHHEAPLMLEHLKTADEYREGRDYIQRVAKEAGVSLLHGAQ
jgi:hypothetical protein